MLSKLIFSSLLLVMFNMHLITSQGPATPAPPAGPPAAPPTEPHWCPPNHPYKGGPVIGPYGQDCTPSSGDCPGACPVGKNALTGAPEYTALKSTAGKIACGVNFDCCACSIMQCIDCVEVNCNGDSGCYGAKNIQIEGSHIDGALITCNGDLSCKETIFQGTNIASIMCSGDNSCQYARMYLECIPEGASLQCVGDNSCSSDPKLGLNAVFQLTNSIGISCSANACRYGYFNLNNNLGGFIECGAYGSCEGSTIIVDQNIISMNCNGLDACRGAAVYITNPAEGFTLLCGAAFSCEGLQLYITITDPTIKHLGDIRCNAKSACANMITMILTIPVLYPRTQTLTVESLTCGAPSACAGTTIIKSANVKFTDCFCSTASLATDVACKGLKGLPKCLAPAAAV